MENSNGNRKKAIEISKHHCKESESVEATDNSRASVQKLSQWLAHESSKTLQHAVVRSNVLSNGAAPVRFRTTPKLQKEDVAATNDKRVSVKTLSEWMSDDPFDQKKIRHIRSGAKVIAKSQIFERKKSTNISMNIEAGSVQNKKAWLANEAFKSESSNDAKRTLPSVEMRLDLKKRKKSPEKALKSVEDKQEWLNTAFRNDVIHSNKQKSENGKNANDETAILKSAIGDETATFYGGEDVAKSPGRTQDERDYAVSVVDRTAWLKGAFEKKPNRH